MKIERLGIFIPEYLLDDLGNDSVSIIALIYFLKNASLDEDDLGHLKVSIRSLSKELKVEYNRLRRAVNKLISCGVLIQETTSKRSYLTRLAVRDYYNYIDFVDEEGYEKEDQLWKTIEQPF